MCSNPLAIQVQTLDGIPAEDTGEIFLYYSPDEGFVCRMDDQPDNICFDYQVRFCCPADPPCDGEWSQWFDKDSPDEGVGDLETLATLCEETCKRPSAIQAQTIDGIPAELTGDVLLRR
ncbi:cartilage intermediate layer protein 1-like [Saccoglossus kowalevskii]